jgi:hypothetical protein
MPCSALKCCDPSETVSVSPVNAALGYVFRCTVSITFLLTVVCKATYVYVFNIRLALLLYINLVSDVVCYRCDGLQPVCHL